MQPKAHSLDRNLLSWTIPRSLYSGTLVLDLSWRHASWREVGPLKVCPFLQYWSFITSSSSSSPVPRWPFFYSLGRLFSEQLILVFSSLESFFRQTEKPFLQPHWIICSRRDFDSSTEGSKTSQRRGHWVCFTDIYNCYYIMLQFKATEAHLLKQHVDWHTLTFLLKRSSHQAQMKVKLTKNNTFLARFIISLGTKNQLYFNNRVTEWFAWE